MTNEVQDPRMTTIHPRIRYNTIGGVNGPLVILDNVRNVSKVPRTLADIDIEGQIPKIQ